MSEFINLIINFLLFYFAVRLAIAFFTLNQIEKQARREDIQKIISRIVHSVKVEQHDGQIYWFDQDNDSFIVQGSNFEDIVNRLQKNYTNHIFILNDRYILSGPDWKLQENKLIDLSMVDK